MSKPRLLDLFHGGDVTTWRVPPGEVLAEKLAEMRMSQTEFARRTGFTPKHVNRIIRAHAGFTADAAVRFERVTGVSALLWLGLQAEYELSLVRLRLAARPLTAEEGA